MTRKLTHLVVFGILLLIGAVTNSALAAPPSGTNWVQTFNEEFNSFNSLDRTGAWKTAYQWGPNHTINNELQYYVDSQNPDNPLPNVNPFSVSNGILNIRTDKNSAPGGKQHTSGVITTFDSFEQKYGYFEMRAKFPLRKGMWGGFWLLPKSGGSPPELDIIEAIGYKPTIVFTTSHSKVNGTNACYTDVAPADTTADFHTYGFKWDSSTLTWYFDGTQVCQFPTQSDQNQPFYILLDEAVGSGGWTSTPDSTNVWPADYQIDYVRVWQQSNQVGNPNLALNHPVTASSLESAQLPASAAVDGNMTTRWSSSYSDPQWIFVDLGARYMLSRVILKWETPYARSYQIQVSDDASTWTSIYTTAAGDGGTDDLTLAGTGRYVRMYGTQRATQYGYSLWELEVYGLCCI